MDKGKIMRLEQTARFERLGQINPEFTLYKCYFMALGVNNNKSNFSREVVDAALPTLKYLPIVAYLYDGEDGKKHIAGHEHRMVITPNGFEEKSLCSAYGVIPDMEFGYEDVEEADGSTATYLVTHAILWTGRYPEVANCAYSDKLAFHASMEIKGIEGSPDPDHPNVMRVDRFRFSALCLLGASDDPKYDYKPCFPTAGLYQYEQADFDALIQALKHSLDKDVSGNHALSDGGEEELKKEQKMNFDHNEDPEVEVSEGQGTVENHDDYEDHDGSAPTGGRETSEHNAQFELMSQKREQLCAAIEKQMSGDGIYAYLIDYDEVYVYATVADYTGDVCARSTMRARYEQVEDGYALSDAEPCVVRYLSMNEAAQIDREREEMEEYRRTHSTDNETVTRLQAFHDERVAEDHKQEVEAVLSRFADLSENEEFKGLRDCALSYTDLSALETACFAIRGKALTPTLKFSAEEGEPRVRIPAKQPKEKPVSDMAYGGLFERYGARNED